ncbi:tRNA (5-methylaminomethyl-2-thiouridylate)-methyltransferase [Austwickia chelonae]|uniref:tRNA-specific 2-thiouridylase MnmA n=1 Tax=Austwickia chelonae NBRC 105200 TaxID=1184607 RepID=K6W4B8_9MICO|nr:tRNA 2-thiouridine(34) synthase MnmA [Austwickia chelonae]GAB76647.1 tRNA-specific 2-thiouridylase MnmA [Austwickia chelonae NBRC 105200]SEW28653.1 tRNA (5-methylaminomethyl-2-thiouridylate)-methyltransferase [Austwickia chelonae]
MRIVAAMSGGVDSAVAASRMVEAGHDVVGVHLALSRSAATLRTSARGCCTAEDSDDARRVADKVGIPFYVWDMAEEFHRDVVEDFLTEYAAGRTPNPCLRCNERIKFAALLDKALALGFDGVATGHYAQVSMPGDRMNTTGRRELHRAVDPAKDQSYVLGVLDAEQLACSFFPLGDSTKSRIRVEAAARGFAVAAKPDSHDICFIADGDTRGYLAARLGEQPGQIVDESGSVVGEHTGAYAYTVGQRRGLALRRPAQDGRPRYVTEVDVPTNRVVIGPEEMLGIDVIVGTRARWCGAPPSGELACGVQLRAHGEEIPAVAVVEEEGQVTIRLARRTRGVAAGQAAVLYEGTRVIGSATICGTSRR